MTRARTATLARPFWRYFLRRTRSMQNNEDLIRQMWEAFTAGDRQKFFAVMADEIKFTVMGTTSLSLVTHGREEMIDRVVTPLAAAREGEITAPMNKEL